MAETVKELVMILGRIVTIIPLLLFVTIFMGKRAIGELPIFDFLIILILGAVVGADIADPNIQHLHTAVAIVAIGIFQRIVASWKIKNRKVGRLITFEPTVVVQNGKLLDNNLRKIRYSMDNILQMLRDKNVFDISEVETAIVESNGGLSVLKKANKNTVIREDLAISKTSPGIALPIIVEGEVYDDVLRSFQKDTNWLQNKLKEHGVMNIKEVFFASINRDLQLHISMKEEKNIQVPRILH
ncbi:uncharacterized membrane protein YcaP (DUF421 family) [Salirhabdus euzebyi]|uniref:Uncharacterized membrane protein YcaP (DUF421 family) n=1 Tax=Salirhabdus euzebyi TaxID=394506 RepID=A0A841Q620_9BACI|nr:DUF421 domain-containing protein [Salirhabdus euzebyi]MBB6453762.1 uncharacterized membrane protein YcaP (DUF421 family) [Salirhabdus euzebyi]